VRDRYRLRVSIIDLVEATREGLIPYLQLDPLVACALRIASDAGWVPIVVSNGETRQQEQMIRKTGLDQYLAGWVISEEAGVSKPNPRIFSIAAQRAGMSLAGAWIIGDGPETDIGGAAAMGLRSVWLTRGRAWGDSRYAPTRVADNILSALAMIMDSG
jgi:putative hydrolase of the HAD superfamily